MTHTETIWAQMVVNHLDPNGCSAGGTPPPQRLSTIRAQMVDKFQGEGQSVNHLGPNGCRARLLHPPPPPFVNHLGPNGCQRKRPKWFHPDEKTHGGGAHRGCDAPPVQPSTLPPRMQPPGWCQLHCTTKAAASSPNTGQSEQLGNPPSHHASNRVDLPRSVGYARGERAHHILRGTNLV